MDRICKLLVLLALPLASLAQPHVLTLEGCREMALENSLNLKSSAERILASHDNLKAYRANNLPNFSLSGGYIYSTASFTETIYGGLLPTFSPNLTTGEMIPNVVGFAEDGSAIFSSYAYMPDIVFDCEVGSLYYAGVLATQPIYMGGKISTATKLARLGVDVAEIEQSRTEADVILSVDEAFYTYLKVGEMLHCANQYRVAVDELYRQVESMLNNGMCTSNDLLRVQVEVNRAEVQQLKATNGVVLARMNLCYIIGLPLATLDIEVVESFNMHMTLDRSLDLSCRPEFKLLEKSVEARELEVKLAQSDFKPTLSALASYNYTNGFKINGETILGSSPSFTGGVVVNVPIFHWGEGRRKVSAARHEVEITRNSQADLMQKMTLELMRSINSYVEAQAEVVLMERTVEQAKENLRQSSREFAVGMVTLTESLEAQALWQKAMGDLVEARANQRIAYAHYCRSRGEE